MQQSPPPPPLHPMIYAGMTPAGQMEVLADDKTASIDYYQGVVIDVCREAFVDPQLLMSKSKTAYLSSWRYGLCLLLTGQYGLSISAAASVLGRSHTTMLYGIGVFYHALSIGDKIATDVAERLYAATGYKITGKPQPKPQHQPR